MKTKPLILLAALLLAAAAHGGTITTAAWTNDASTGIAPGRTLWAHHFGATTTATVNGEIVTGLAGPNASNANLDLTGMTTVFNGDTNNVTGTGSTVMAQDFVYGGNPSATVTVKGLTAGRNYVVSLFSVGWQSDGGDPNYRLLTFSSGTDSQTVQQSQFGADNGLRVDYAFTATAATRAITIAVANANSATFHLYGIALQRPPAVTTANDSGAGSLRQALLDAASYAGADSVMFDAGMNGSTITLLSEIVSNDASGAVHIDASTLPAGVTIDGGPNANRILTVSAGRNVSLTRLTLTGGNGGGAAQNGNGGAIVNFGTLNLTRCTLSGNSGDNAGAILNDGGSMTLSESTVSGNQVTGAGGGLFQTTGTTTLMRCTLTGNHSNGDGGAIFNQVGSLALTHCTIAGNDAGINAAIYNNNAPISLQHSIIAGNSANTGIKDLATTSVVTVTGVNFIGDPAGSGLAASATLLTTAANGAINLAALGNYGGPTQTMPPLAGSPAIDAAIGSTATSDQRGVTIVAAPDLGAVEIGSRVTTTADQLDTPAGAQVSLREAVRDCPEGGLVDFAPALSGQALLLASEIIPSASSLSIDASNLPAVLTIGGSPSGNRHFSVSSGKSLALLGLRIIGGKGGGAAQNGNGNAIANFGTLALTRCTFTANNRATGGSGGAILNDGGTTTLTQCTLSGNSTTNGGAIFQTTGTTTLTQCTLSGNSAGSGGVGGALYNGSGTLTLARCTLAGNGSAGDAGAIFNNFGTLALTHCTLSDNHTTNFGGAIFLFGGTLTLTHGIAAGNTAGSGGPDIHNNSGNITATGVNFIGNTSGSGLTASSTLLTTAANGSINLAALGNYGGPTQTMPPLAGSPAIDAAIGSTATSDQRGVAIAGVPDLGAVENGSRVTVATDQLDTPSGAQVSLREAVRDAPAGGIVDFAAALSGQTLGLTPALGGEITVNKGVSIDASRFASGIIVSTNNTGRGFRIAPGVSASFVRLTITGCYVPGSGFPGSYGGGIYVEGALTLTECQLMGNGAFVGAGAYVANNGAATLTLQRSTVAGNGADYGGGIQNEGTLVAHGSTFAGNVASLQGGAISAPFSKPVALLHCTVTQNTAGTGGGVMGDNFTLTNSIVSGNIGPDYSGSPGVLIGVNWLGGNALLAPLGDFGGPTQTVALLPGSPVRNAAAVLSPAITTDQRGFPIVGTPDIGAYEADTFNSYDAWIWETLPATATTPQHASTFDFDGDGQTNGSEWIALTNPDAGNSRFAATPVRSGVNLEITIPTATGRTYTLFQSDTLVGGSWIAAPGFTPQPGTGSPITFQIPIAGARMFYEVQVSLP